MKLVIALGGNALLKRGEALTLEAQKKSAEKACQLIAEVAQSHQVILTHGNGPQVGMLAMQSMGDEKTNAFPFDILDAESEGMIGYVLEQQLRNFLPDKKITTILTQIAVDNKDPAFTNPTKFIGAVYKKAEANNLAQKNQWQIKPDGEHYRRVIASPQPLEILELASIQLLIDAGVLVICCGGGGIPVVQNQKGEYEGVEAVIDKDMTSSLLARKIKADRLVILTDVSGVMENWGTDNAQPIKEISVSELEDMKFSEGSMMPKIKAACEFVKATGNTAHIGALEDVVDVIDGSSGTKVNP